VDCPDDFFEPDNAPAQSLNLNPTATSAGHAFCSTNDEDWFRFSGVAGNQYRIETLNLGGGNDTILTLYNSALTQLAVDDDSGSEFRASRIDYVTPSSGTYYVKATRFAGLRNFAYTYDLRITRDQPPTITAPATGVRNNQTMGVPSAGTYDVALQDQWSPADPDGISSQDLEECRNSGCTFSDVSPSPAASATAYNYRLTVGTQMRRRIRAFDTLGAFSPYATGPTFTLRGVQQGNGAFSYIGVWTTSSNTAFYGGTLTTTAGGGGTRATLRFTGRSVGVVGARRANGGKANIVLDGVTVGVVDFYAAFPQNRRIVFAATGLAPTRPDGSAHVLEVRWRTDKNPSSTARRLFIDGAVMLE
jgi:hypothetical protein